MLCGGGSGSLNIGGSLGDHLLGLAGSPKPCLAQIGGEFVDLGPVGADANGFALLIRDRWTVRSTT